MTEPQLIDIQLHQDDRGYVYCALDNMLELGIKRTYVVENFARGQVRAWHLHLKGDTYFHVVGGAIKACALRYDVSSYWDNGDYIMPSDSDKRDAYSFVLTDRKPQLFKIPAGWYNGAMSLTDNTKLLVYSTLSFDECKMDDNRLAWSATPELWKVENR